MPPASNAARQLTRTHPTAGGRYTRPAQTWFVLLRTAGRGPETRERGPRGPAPARTRTPPRLQPHQSVARKPRSHQGKVRCGENWEPAGEHQVLEGDETRKQPICEIRSQPATENPRSCGGFIFSSRVPCVHLMHSLERTTPYRAAPCRGRRPPFGRVGRERSSPLVHQVPGPSSDRAQRSAGLRLCLVWPAGTNLITAPRCTQI